MRVALFTHDDCLGHDTGPGHAECADRLRVVLRALEHPDFVSLLREAAPLATAAQLCRVHEQEYVGRLLALEVPVGTRLQLDEDTVASPGSVAAALRAAGGAVAAVDAVMEGWAEAAFVAVRPPGHHAEPSRAMGFCLFNSVAVAAHRARDRWGLRRVAVVDFDVHHGNGTEAMFASDPELFYASSHQCPCYPGTGVEAERGVGGNIANAVLSPGSGSTAFRAAWAGRLLPALEAFAPELLILSAGFDAHRADPLAQLRVEVDDFEWLTGRLMEVADRHCGSRLVSVLEGGYDLGALAACVGAHVRCLIHGPVSRQHVEGAGVTTE
ncbi:MAG: histone deacetylase family protein [Janthinobacterium lividum]